MATYEEVFKITAQDNASAKLAKVRAAFAANEKGVEIRDLDQAFKANRVEIGVYIAKLGALEVQTKRLTRAQDQFNAAAGGGFGGKNMKGTGQAAYVASQAIEDLQYGIHSVVNNIPQLAMALGGGAGVAAAASLAAIAVSQLSRNFDFLGSSVDTSLTSLQRMKAELTILEAKKDPRAGRMGAEVARIESAFEAGQANAARPTAATARRSEGVADLLDSAGGAKAIQQALVDANRKRAIEQDPTIARLRQQQADLPGKTAFQISRSQQGAGAGREVNVAGLIAKQQAEITRKIMEREADVVKGLKDKDLTDFGEALQGGAQAIGDLANKVESVNPILAESLRSLATSAGSGADAMSGPIAEFRGAGANLQAAEDSRLRKIGRDIDSRMNVTEGIEDAGQQKLAKMLPRMNVEDRLRQGMGRGNEQAVAADLTSMIAEGLKTHVPEGMAQAMASGTVKDAMKRLEDEKIALQKDPKNLREALRAVQTSGLGLMEAQMAGMKMFSGPQTFSGADFARTVQDSQGSMVEKQIDMAKRTNELLEKMERHTQHLDRLGFVR